MKNKWSDIAVIDVCRTPFQRSGTGYYDMMAWETGSAAVRALLARNGLTGCEIDHVIMGSVATDIATTNVAREIALGAGVPDSVPAHTCTIACISANMAITTACDMIQGGSAAAVIAGGVESFSDPDIKISKKYRRLIMDLTMFKKNLPLISKIRAALRLGIRDYLIPEAPSVREYFSKLTMGETAERLAKRLSISREEQDRYALLSHNRAHQAQERGDFDHEIVPVTPPGAAQSIALDNGPRGDSSMEKLGRLKSAFDPVNGTVTAGNSSFLTDGASAVLLMSRKRAKELRLRPVAYIRAYAYTGQDIWDELLLGPAFAIPVVLEKTGIRFRDIGIFEIHEAFAVQMLAVKQCLSSAQFARERLGLRAVVGTIPDDRLNPLGGSLSIGHPFGATGGRLLGSCANELKKNNHRFGIIAGCAAGALGNAIVIENAG